MTQYSQASTGVSRRSLPSRLRRWALAAAGCGFVGLGAIGVAVPGLPTTCFVLLASFCFAYSSPRMHRWLEQHRWFGPYLEMARARRMPLRAKVISLLLMWSGITFALFVTDQHGWLVQAALILAGFVGTWVIVFALRTAPPRAFEPESP